MTVVNSGSRTAQRGAALAVALLALLAALPAGAGSKSPRAAPTATTTVFDWGWENPLPQGSALSGVSCPTATFCKVVGGDGTILSWDGANWSADSSGTSRGLKAVSCASATLCKAVTFDLILSWDGTSWSVDSSGTLLDLNSVSCPTATLCKAVSSGGAIMSWDGTSWSFESSGTQQGLYGVSCPTTTLCKAVGAGGTIRSWNGTNWSADSSAPVHLWSVSCPTATLCKAAGESGWIVSWDGTSWTDDSVGGPALKAVSCPTTTLCKAVGDAGRIMRWNGTSWGVESAGTSSYLAGVSCPTATFCKVVGGDGTILSWDGANWSADSSGTSRGLKAVSCASATLCKAVGDSGAILGMVVQALTDVAPGFVLDLFHTGCLDGLTISQTNSNHPNATVALQTGKFWTITVSPATCGSGYSAFLTVPTSFAPDANSRVCRYTGPAGWECAQNGFTASSVSRWNVTQFSDWAASMSGPTAVKLSRLAARPRAGGIAVSWHTESETDLVGFNLYREQRGKLVKLNWALIPSVFGGTTKGHSYSWLDRRVRRGVKYTYRLEAVSLDETQAWVGTAVARR